MRARVLLPLVLLVAGAWPVASAQSGPSVEPSSGDLATLFRFSWDEPVRRGGDALANGDFRRGFAGWSADDSELQGAASFAVGPDGASVSVALAPLPGTAHLRQRVPIAAGAYELAVEANGSGGFEGFALLLRETGFPEGRHPLPFLDTVHRPPVTAGPSRSVLAWHPRDPSSTHVEVYLRLAFRGGDSGEATFRSVSLTPVTSLSWDTRDGAPPRHGPALVHRFAQPGEHAVVARVHHPGEAPREAVVPVRVENRPPAPQVELRREPSSGRHVADARGSFDPDGVETRLLNPSFDDGLASWGFSSAEIGVEGAAAVENGWLRLRAGPARFPGSVFAFQDVPIAPGRSYALEVDARDAPGIEAHELIVRERGGSRGVQDHRARFDPVGEDRTRLRMHFTPRHDDSTHVTLHLRVLVAAGATVDVAYDDVSLREDLRYEWALDGAPLPRLGPRVDLHPAPGNRTLTLTVTDATGASATLTRAFDAALPSAAPAPAILAPAFARVWEPAFLFAAGSRPAETSEALLDGGFDRGIASWSRVGDATVSEGVLLLRPGPDAPAEVSQRAPLSPFVENELRVRHRAASPGAVLEVVIEETTVDPWGDARVRDRRVERVLAGEPWSETRIAWSARDAASNEARVRLRAPAGASAGAVLVDDVSFGPALEYEWLVGDEGPQRGFGVRHVFREPGGALVTLVARDASGARNATSVQVPVLANGSFAAVPALSGGVRLAADLTLHPRFRAFDVVRSAAGSETTLEAPLRARFVVADPAPPVGVPLEYRLRVLLDNGTREVVARANATLAPGAPVGAVEAPARVRRGETAELSAVAPADAARVTGRLSWGPFSRAIEFAPAATPGLWTATHRPGPFAFPGEHTLRVEARDAQGRATLLGVETQVRVGLTDGGEDALLLALLAAPAAAWAVRRARKEGWTWRR